MTGWRETFIDLDVRVRIRYPRSEPPPPIEYAITLETEIAGIWTTVALWDNADAPDEHHRHRYTRSYGKYEPTTLAFPTANEAMADAIRTASTQWKAILRIWSES